MVLLNSISLTQSTYRCALYWLLWCVIIANDYHYQNSVNDNHYQLTKEINEKNNYY
tara:strand:- start:604 stop:771 length:168 start_codon:yes stop_codon:yes gene_type:complete